MRRSDWRGERERAAAERVALDADAAFVGMRESPDAHLRGRDGREIGLEIVSVVDQEFLDARKRMVETTEQIGRDLAAQGLARHVEIGFSIESFGAGAGALLREQLGRLALSRFDAQPSGKLDEREVREAGVDGVAWLLWYPSEVPGAGWGYRKSTAPGGTLVDIILAKKHAKLRSYRETSKERFDSYWLAIDSLGPGTVEDGGFVMLLGGSYETTFDRVFLLMGGAQEEFERATDVTPRGQPATSS